MSSSRIADMHVFLEMKKKFPDLPEETLRDYILLYSKDQDKCVDILQRERQLNTRASLLQSENWHQTSALNHGGPKSSKRNPDASNHNQSAMPPPARTHDGVVHLQNQSQLHQKEPYSKSAPVLQSQNSPFSDMYTRHSPLSSHRPTDENCNRMLFSTTKEHVVPAGGDHHSTAVSLSLVPSFPFQAGGRSELAPITGHTTSVNFHLSSHPVQIRSVPVGPRTPDHGSFGSHVQISMDGHGTTFTALRVQRPPQEPETRSAGQVFRSEVSRSVGGQGLGDWNGKQGFVHGFQASPDYISAVKNHQLTQLDLLQDELDKERERCSSMKTELNVLEQKIVHNKEKEHSFTHAEVLKKLKEENRKLRLECNCLIMEHDLNVRGQNPVDSTAEDFYSNIFTGPNEGLSHSTGTTQVKGVHLPASLPKAGSKEDDDDDERNKWRCKKCTYDNHAALEICEVCEIPKNSDTLFPAFDVL